MGWEEDEGKDGEEGGGETSGRCDQERQALVWES